MRVPSPLPAHAVRRVVCQRCAESYEPAEVVEGRSHPLTWRNLRLPVAAVAVVAGLSVIQGGDDGEEPAGERSPSAELGLAEAVAGGEARARGGGGSLISESTFQLALPAGWERTTPSGGATFAAGALDGSADVTLWIERDPKLDFASFEERSLAQLESLAGSAAVVERRPGPTPESSAVLIAPTSAPAGAPHYEALLVSSGNRWYYLATTTQPDAGREARDAVELIRSSFSPLRGGK